jgi:hypothetical protein
MRSKLFLGLAGVALLAVIGAAWAASGTTPAADQPEAGAVAAVITPAERPPEPPCCCSAKSAPVIADCCCKVVDGKWVCQITGAVSDECCCIPLTDSK